MLAFLERANPFLVPLDEERRSYRLHDLFREALLACLQTSQPELVPLLNYRAASFCDPMVAVFRHQVDACHCEELAADSREWRRSTAMTSSTMRRRS